MFKNILLTLRQGGMFSLGLLEAKNKGKLGKSTTFSFTRSKTNLPSLGAQLKIVNIF